MIAQTRTLAWLVAAAAMFSAAFGAHAQAGKAPDALVKEI